MRRAALILLVVLVFIRPPSSAAGPGDRAGAGGTETSLSSSLDSDGSFRNRVSASLRGSFGCIDAYVEERFSDGEFELPTVGLASPLLDAGALRERGLLRELCFPLGIGSIKERSAVALDRSPGASSPGGVVRLGSPPAGKGVALYALRRGGRAAAGSATGGVLLRGQPSRSVGFDLASTATVFPAQEEEEAWFLDRAAVALPAVLRGGGRLRAKRGGLEGNLSGGVALSDRLPPAGFCSGFVGLSGSIPVGFEPGRIGSVGLGARIEGGACSPSYVCGDRRYVSKTGFLHPVVSLRLPGLTLQASYGYTIYRVPLLPVVNRRTVQNGSIDMTVQFGALSVGGVYRPRLEYGEDGRTLFASTSGVRSMLAVGRFALRGEVNLRQANDSPREVGAELSAASSWRRGECELWVGVEERACSIGAGVSLAGRLGRARAAVEFRDLFAVDLERVSAARNGGLRTALERGGVSVSWSVYSR